MTSASASAWQTFADLLDPPENPYVRDPVGFDEAGGVPKSIFDAVDALAANVDTRVVAVGNPDDPASHFATICKPGSGWHVETISAFDTPAYTGKKVPEDLLPLLVSPEWVEERKLHSVGSTGAVRPRPVYRRDRARAASDPVRALSALEAALGRILRGAGSAVPEDAGRAPIGQYQTDSGGGRLALLTQHGHGGGGPDRARHGVLPRG